jgi:hypothetical protein
MMTMLRRLFWLALLGSAGCAGWTIWQRKQASAPAAAPEWPPLTGAGAPEPSAATLAAMPDEGDDPAEPGAGGDRWVAPLDDGGCPDGFPVKANDNSGIYHVPGGRFYDRTVPERCYARTEECEADGYRAAKS